MITSKTLLLTFVLIFFGSQLYANEPGKRDGQAPWFGLGSIPDHITDLIFDLEDELNDNKLEVAELISERDEQLSELNNRLKDAPWIGKPLVSDSKEDIKEEIAGIQEKYREKITELRKEQDASVEKHKDKIISSLSAPYNSMMEARKEEIGDYQADNEMFEIINAANNAREVVARLNSELRLDNSNAGTAVRTYQAQARLCAIVVHIYDTYIYRVDNVYGRDIKAIDQRIELDIEMFEDNKDDLGEELAEAQVEQLELIREQNELALDMLEENLETAEEYRDAFVKQHKIAKAMERVASRALESNQYIARINNDIEGMTFEMPELIKYEFKPTTIQKLR